MASCAGFTANSTINAAEFLDRYLDALVEELVAPHTSVCMHMLDPASSPMAEEFEE
jgi:hypothetical protein